MKLSLWWWLDFQLFNLYVWTNVSLLVPCWTFSYFVYCLQRSLATDLQNLSVELRKKQSTYLKRLRQQKEVREKKIKAFCFTFLSFTNKENKVSNFFPGHFFLTGVVYLYWQFNKPENITTVQINLIVISSLNSILNSHLEYCIKLHLSRHQFFSSLLWPNDLMVNNILEVLVFNWVG